MLRYQNKSDSFFKSVQRLPTDAHPLQVKEPEPQLFAAMVDDSVTTQRLTVNLEPITTAISQEVRLALLDSTEGMAKITHAALPHVLHSIRPLETITHMTLFTSPEYMAQQNAERYRFQEEFFSRLPQESVLERYSREMRRNHPGLVDLLNRSQDLYTRAQRRARPESDFAHWWTSPETQQRYQQSRTELAVREVDLNAGKLASYVIEIPEEFLCPLSYEIITTPVYDPRFPQHQRCELLVMKAWLDEKHTNPFNREPLSIGDVVCDEALKHRIDDFVRTSILNATPSSFRSGTR